MGFVSDIIAKGYGGYAGWPDAAAQADFNATKGNGKFTGGGGGGGGGNNSGGGGSSGNPLQDANAAIQNSFQKLMGEVSSKFSQYKSSHPFSLDQILALKSKEAHEQIDPYYNETLSNYLSGVNRKITRSKADTADLLTELSADTKSFETSHQLKLNEAINQARQGFTDSGLFFSGNRARGEGLLQVGGNQDLADYTRKTNLQGKGYENDLSRNLEDIAASKTQNVRDLERSRYTDITTRANDLTKEAGQQYIQGFKSTLPTELQAASGFDALKDLGIYN